MITTSAKKTTPFLLDTGYLQLLLLALVVVLTYGHTLDVPFYLDDFSSIQENPVIYQWQGTLGELWRFAALRIIGYLTFALNYQVHQFQVAGYHLVNILIHLLTGYAVWGLLRGLVRTPLLTDTLSPATKHWLPLTVALLFLLHPLQIQAVTYIVQRLASLAALFYIGALASFIQARLSHSALSRNLWALSCLLLILLAFFTKQNTATLPIALLLLELTFFPLHRPRLILIGTFALFGMVSIWVILALVFQQNPFSLHAMQALTQETTEISRTAYLATQMSVLWTYLHLFIWPSSSHIDYDYPITNSFLVTNPNYHLVAQILHSEALVALGGHLILLGLAYYYFRRRPLVAFSIFFYYLAHTIESSVIPIRDVIFEHRTYLPNLGLTILLGWLLVEQLPQTCITLGINRAAAKTTTVTVIVIVLLILATSTWQRNQKWRDPIALWQHNVEQSPGQQRGWIILGKHLLQAKRPEEGLAALNHAVIKELRGDGAYTLSVSPETALNIVVAYKMLRQYDQALKWIDTAFLNPTLRPFDQAKFLVNKGNIFYEQGRYPEAEASYRQAIQVYPQNLKARINLAGVFGITGRHQEAVALYQEVLAIEPSNEFVNTQLQRLLTTPTP